MAKLLPRTKITQIKEIAYARADTHGYMSSGRVENGKFMNDLVEDPEIGGVLSEYMEKEKIRTYIKDTILNRYSKDRIEEVLKANPPVDAIQKVYSVAANEIQIADDVVVCRSENGAIYIVSSGTYQKWETALKKALELIARQPTLIIDGKIPEICLQLIVLSMSITDGDKELISNALSAINVKARFCSN